jgi:hypothetical protein
MEEPSNGRLSRVVSKLLVVIHIRNRKTTLKPEIAGSRSFSAMATRVWRSTRFNQEQLGLNRREWFVLYSFRNDEHLARLQVNRTISEVDP